MGPMPTLATNRSPCQLLWEPRGTAVYSSLSEQANLIRIRGATGSDFRSGIAPPSVELYGAKRDNQWRAAAVEGRRR
jgi:hypothetical protein